MKILLSLLVIPILLILSGYQAFGQIPSESALRETIKVTIDESGIAHVTHVVNSTMMGFQPLQVDMINGNVTNLNVTDGSGKTVEYSKIKSPLSIVLNTQQDVTLIKYDLINAVTNTAGVWKWNYYEPQDTDFTAFHFPKGVDTIWANNRPVYIGGHGLGQRGNGFTLEYSINEPVTIQNVQDTGKSFAVGIRTVSGLGNYSFDRSLDTYSFSVNNASVPVTVIMPQDLLVGPYTVTSNGKPVLHQEFHSNATHAWIGFKSDKSGTVQIAGATPGQVPQSGSSNNSAIISSGPTQPSDNTTIYLVIGGIIAAGIAGLVIVKKSRAKSPTSV